MSVSYRTSPSGTCCARAGSGLLTLNRAFGVVVERMTSVNGCRRRSRRVVSQRQLTRRDTGGCPAMPNPWSAGTGFCRGQKPFAGVGDGFDGC
jgi:hypothetical protein